MNKVKWILITLPKNVISLKDYLYVPCNFISNTREIGWLKCIKVLVLLTKYILSMVLFLSYL